MADRGLVRIAKEQVRRGASGPLISQISFERLR
jgi:hypothetical protein